MRIGFLTIQPYKKLNDQFMGTVWFTLMVPLIPIQSRWFLDDITRAHYDIGLYGPHVAKAYAVIFSFVGTVLLVLPELIEWHMALRVLAIVGLWAGTILLLLKYNRMSDEEKDLRELFGSIVGVNALPKYLNEETAMVLRNSAVLALRNQLEAEEFLKEIVEKELYGEAEHPLLFVIYAYECRLNPSAENTALRDDFYARTMELKAKEVPFYRRNLGESQGLSQ